MRRPSWALPIGLKAAILVQSLGLGPATGPLLPGEEPAPAAAEEPASSATAGKGVVDVGLYEIRRDPTLWLGRRVRFVLQFQRSLETWNPLLTRFGTSDWVGIAAWADERFTWEANVFDDPMQRLFVRRGSAAAELVGEIRPHERFEVVGVVREIFLDEPWIELERFRPRSEIVAAGVILHVLRAKDAAKAKQWRLAADQLERAMAAPLPEPARAELEARHQACLARATPQSE